MRRSVFGALVGIALLAVALEAVAALPDENAKWIRADTDHFTLVGNAGRRLTVTVARNLERLRDVLSRATAGFDQRSSLGTLIYVFADEPSFRPFNLGPDGKPENLAGYFLASPDGYYVAFDSSAGERPFPVIYHEYIHSVMENTLPDMPLWLNEGLAEFYSSIEVMGDRARIGMPLHDHLAWLAGHPLIPLEALFAVNVDSPQYNEQERQGTFYAQSWALVHMLAIGDPAHKSRMGGFLRAIQQGTDSRQAFERAFGIELGVAQQQLAEYVRLRSFTYATITFDEAFDEEAVATRPLERKELLLRLGDLLAHHPSAQPDEAELHLRAALAIDSTLTDAWTTLALLRLRQERPAEAIELCQRAIALDAKSVRAHRIHGHSLLARFRETIDEEVELGSSTPALLASAREAFRQSLAIVPDDPETLAGLGRTYLLDRESLAEGQDALGRAVQALPARTDLLRDLVILTANSGNRAGAKRLLEVLRRRAPAEDVEAAEIALASPEFERAHALLQEGRLDEGRAVLEALAAEVPNEKVAAQVRAALAAVSAATASAAEVDLFNTAQRAAGGGDLEEAARQFELLAASAADPALRSASAANAAEARRILDHNRDIALFNEGVGQANAGDYRGAVAKLEALLAGGAAPTLEDETRKLLDELRPLAAQPATK